MKTIRKYAVPLSVLAVLAASIAAPYMVSLNPDSMVFRNGTLGLLLLCAAGSAVPEALHRADRRTLLAGLCWGFLFACALSIGSELYVYDGLLPGFSALVRRMAVPVLATPLLGGFAARLMLQKETVAPIKKARPIPFFVFFVLILLCWLPLLPAYYPAMLNYDFPNEYRQHLEGYSSLHPLLHSAIVNTIVTIGESIHSRTFGVLLMSLVQMTSFAGVLAYSCSFAQRKGAPRLAVLALAALYALHPVFSAMSLSMTKDTLFAASALWLSLLSYEAIDNPDAFFASKKKLVSFPLAAVGTALMRNNGVFALVLLFPGLIIVLKSRRKCAFKLCAGSAAACLLTLGALTAVLQPVSESSFQLYSLPAQQLVRAYNVGVMTDEQKDQLESWYTSENGLRLQPHLADSAKGLLDRDRIAKNGDDFLALWAKVGKKNLHVYTEALLMLNVGSWYPDDLSHSTIYPDVTWSDKGYLQTQEYDMTPEGIYNMCHLPAVRDVYERICRYNELQKYPIISVLLCTATPLWVLLFACCHFAARKNTRMIVASLGALGIWLSFLLGPCTLPRYTLTLFCLAPVFLLLSYTAHPKDTHS